MDPDRRNIMYGVRKNMRKSLSEDMFQHMLTLGAYSGVAAVVTFFLHMSVARILGPHDYATYGTYVAILFTVFFCLTSVHLVITRFVAYYNSRFQFEQITYLIYAALKYLFFAGLGVFIFITLFSKAISSFFQLDSIIPTILLGLVLWITMLVPILEGAYKGFENYHALGKFRLAESLARLVLVLSFTLIGFSVSGALFGLGLGTLVGLVISLKTLRSLLNNRVHKPDVSPVWRFAIPVAISMVSLGLLLNMDIIMVKHYFIGAQAGVFAAASLLAKVPFLLSMVLIGVFFPKVTRLHADGKNSTPVLKKALQTLVPLSAFWTLLTFFLAEPIFKIFFGPEYVIGPSLGLYVFSMSALAIATLLVGYLLALQKDGIAKILPAMLAFYIVLILLFHESILQVMIVAMLIMALLFSYVLFTSRNLLDFDYFL